MIISHWRKRRRNGERVRGIKRDLNQRDVLRMSRLYILERNNMADCTKYSVWARMRVRARLKRLLRGLGRTIMQKRRSKKYMLFMKLIMSSKILKQKSCMINLERTIFSLKCFKRLNRRTLRNILIFSVSWSSPYKTFTTTKLPMLSTTQDLFLVLCVLLTPYPLVNSVKA